jgi:glycosyltransferase involved in cell wall biosynthesis
MRILHVAKRYPDSFGGDAIVVWQLVRRQRAAGHTVHILTSNCTDIRDAPGLTKMGLAISSSALDAINLKRILTLIWLVPRSFWYLRRARPDVIHSHTADFGFALSFAARAYRIPMINTCHGVSFINPDHSLFKRKLETFFLKAARYRLILTVDRTSLAGFHKAGIGHVRYIDNAVDRERFKTAPPYWTGRLELFNVGRVETAKGMKVLLNALAILPPKLDWRLRVAGPGAQLDAYTAYAAQLGLADKVRFLGKVMPKDNATLYASSHIFILPSLHEGFPIVLLEAWAAGLPVIITEVGTVTDVCRDGENALLVNPGSSEQLAAAIGRLANDAELRRRLARNGQRLVREKYTYEALLPQVMAVYEEVTA